MSTRSPEIPSLPLLARRAEIESALRDHRVVVIAGETGSGKTTQLPQILHALAADPRRAIAHTQPRRLAARAVASRIAEEMRVPLGGLVGYKVRLDDRTSSATRIKVMTDGVLLAELAGDPALDAYHTVIIDEAHERSLTIDILLGVLKRLLQRRTDLRVVVTSATIDPRRFSDFFGGAGAAPVIEVSGRMFPVEVRYAPHGVDPDDPADLSPEVIADAVESLVSPRLPEGDVLVFLPGEKEIRQTADVLRRRGLGDEVLPLFSRLSPAEQDRIFHPAGPRRVILATNIAETSLTVPRVRYVVDTGLARITRYDPQRKVSRLPVEFVSKASANQRSGRCGRVADGIAIRLGSRADFEKRPEFTDPEIRRTSLAGTLLLLKSLGLGHVAAFPFLDPPDPSGMRDAAETLFELGALPTPDPEAPLTTIGRRLARLPLDPRIGRMLLAADDENAVSEVLTLTAALSIQDPRVRPAARADEADRAHLIFRNPESDFLTLLNVYDQYQHARDSGGVAAWCRDQFLSLPRMREWTDTREHLAGIARDLGLRENTQPATPDRVHRALLPGLASNVACREAASTDYRGVRGNVVSLFPGSVLFAKPPKWIMAAEVVQTTRLYARTIAKIDPEWLEEIVPHILTRTIGDRHLDPETGEPSAWERVTMSGVVLVPRRRVALAPHDASGARAIFLKDALAAGAWSGPHAFLAENRATLDHATQIAARLRRRDVLQPPEALAAWFDARLPASVRDPATLDAALRDGSVRTEAITLTIDDVVRPETCDAVRRAADPAYFPHAVPLADEPGAPSINVQYVFNPGSEDDGVSFHVHLADLPRVSPARLAWLVPGLLPDVLLALLKTLPKSAGEALRGVPPAADLAAACAEVMDFGQGELPAAFTDTLATLFDVRLAPDAFSLAALPTHLRPRLVVLDHDGKVLAAERDAAALVARLTPRAAKAAAARARRVFERDDITRWDFDLADSVEVEHEGAVSTGVPTLVERDGRVALTLVASTQERERLLPRALRRLAALQCRDEVEHHRLSFSAWPDLVRLYAPLGPEDELADAATCLIAERAFLHQRPTPRTPAEFDTLLREQWGRLPTASRDVLEMIAAVLEPRAKIAQRLSGGTPRIWAASIADIREHAAYLLPRGFLSHLPWDRLRHYPRYVLTLRERLLNLREGGSSSEAAALTTVAEPWKRFTGWVARAMAAQARAGEAPSPSGAKRPPKAPLPQARRAAPTVNLDAGEWAIRPEHLPPAVGEYRWALEEFRAALFAASRPSNAPTPETLRTLWAKVT